MEEKNETNISGMAGTSDRGYEETSKRSNVQINLRRTNWKSTNRGNYSEDTQRFIQQRNKARFSNSRFDVIEDADGKQR